MGTSAQVFLAIFPSTRPPTIDANAAPLHPLAVDVGAPWNDFNFRRDPSQFSAELLLQAQRLFHERARERQFDRESDEFIDATTVSKGFEGFNSMKVDSLIGKSIVVLGKFNHPPFMCVCLYVQCMYLSF